MDTNEYASLSREDLLKLLKDKDGEINNLKSQNLNSDNNIHIIKDVLKEAKTASSQSVTTKLSNEDISRYSRQLILPELGVKGQVKLKNSSVLIVGAGGLGCPSSLYLAAAGVGRIGVIDYDEVEVSNLHRQVSHKEDRVGLSKALSVALSCKSLNSSVEYIPYHFQINSLNALEVIKRYDIVLDATDNVATRYLLNDACVLAGKPLVSGSALRFEGQLTVYNCDGGPCYRCLFPQPPPPETVTNCSDGGVLGVVPGIIGSLQALETIKIAAGIKSSYCQKMLLFDALDGTFRNIKLRPRSPACIVCGDNPTLCKLIDYEQFCGAKASDKDKHVNLLDETDRLLPRDYALMLENGAPHVLVDVRPSVELDICGLPHQAINITLSEVQKSPDKVVEDIHQKLLLLGGESDSTAREIPVVCVCRKGNDSQMVVQILRKHMPADSKTFRLMDLQGGLHAWAKKVDRQFPIY